MTGQAMDPHVAVGATVAASGQLQQLAFRVRALVMRFEVHGTQEPQGCTPWLESGGRQPALSVSELVIAAAAGRWSVANLVWLMRKQVYSPQVVSFKHQDSFIKQWLLLSARVGTVQDASNVIFTVLYTLGDAGICAVLNDCAVADARGGRQAHPVATCWQRHVARGEQPLCAVALQRELLGAELALSSVLEAAQVVWRRAQAHLLQSP